MLRLSCLPWIKFPSSLYPKLGILVGVELMPTNFGWQISHLEVGLLGCMMCISHFIWNSQIVFQMAILHFCQLLVVECDNFSVHVFNFLLHICIHKSYVVLLCSFYTDMLYCNLHYFIFLFLTCIFLFHIFRSMLTYATDLILWCSIV